jgi:hypothetical protein
MKHKLFIIVLGTALLLPNFTQGLSYQDVYNSQQGMVLGAATALTDGLVAYWNFDEGSGTTANDSSGNNYTGTVNNATWTAGKVGSGALDFNGNNSNVSVSNVPNLTGQTYSMWINPRSGGSGGIGRIFTKGGNGAILRMSFATGISFLSYCSGTTLIDTHNNVLTDNAWNFVAVTWNGQCGANSGVT